MLDVSRLTPAQLQALDVTQLTIEQVCKLELEHLTDEQLDALMGDHREWLHSLSDDELEELKQDLTEGHLDRWEQKRREFEATQ